MEIDYSNDFKFQDLNNAKHKPCNALWLVLDQMSRLHKGHAPSIHIQCKHVRMNLSEEARLRL